MEQLLQAIWTLEKLQDNTKGVSVSTALDEVSWFMSHDLQDVLDWLKQVESEMAAVGAATTSEVR
ncbi:hypothetical protein FLT15_17915 [Paenibacillus thiaminolyticus]|uniref:hypothetical protein n=1 Tax=Paenibacillus thiaminolyticus TaxID=49283 RepID=UPI0011624D51|nr:hypothetical protein [Paenibacillus thiaminolyticus]NGP60019.1 hypothetical protein [Paenibacillus thiaminolyticus]NGP60095.1 hypothetical protein [Paenibacillus thiaminolyticus]NGP60132.1 hypothetical protein [Paenibacillus thiaminolyticus]